MNFSKFCLYSLLAFSTLALTACPSPKSKKSTQPKMIRVVMGDPEKLIKNTVKVSEIPADFLSGTSEVHLESAYQFSEIAHYSPSSERNLEEENAASEKSDSDETDPFIFTVKTADAFETKIASEFLNLTLILRKNAKGNFEINSIYDGKTTIKSKLHHFSSSADGRFFSFLIGDSSDAETGKTLTALYFSRGVIASDPDLADEKYYYLDGPGTKNRWSKNSPLEIETYSSAPYGFNKEVNLAISQWSNALQSQLVIKSNTSAHARPFTDLNQRGLTVIDGFLTEPDPNAANYGATVNIIDHENHEFVDADIFIFSGEYAKNGVDMMSPELSLKRNFTLVHELGHLLGLDHQFDGTPSIMSYEFTSARLQAYDLEAIKALYAD